MSDKARLLYSTTTLATSLLLLLGLSSEYLSFNFVSISLSGVSNYISYEDVKGEVYSSFSNFESFACRKSRNEDILTICGNIFTFELSGLVFKTSLVLCILLNLFVTYLVLHKKLVSFFPYVSPVIYFIGSFLYLSMNSGQILDPSDNQVKLNYERGVFLMFMSNILNILICFYFFYYSKLETLQLQELVENMGQELKDENIRESQERDTKANSMILDLLSQSIAILESTQPQQSSPVNDKILESLKLQMGLLHRLQGIDGGSKVADEIESTKRFSSQVSIGKSQDDHSIALTSDRVDRLVNENKDLKLEMSRMTIKNESFVEENERQKRILENHNRLLTEKQLKIEELERSKKILEQKERNLLESNAELKKFTKEYEEVLIQAKKEKDDVMKSLQSKEKELELLQTHVSTLKTESDALKTIMSPGALSDRSAGDIQVESLTSQVFVLNEVLKNEKNEKNCLVKQVEELNQTCRELDLKLKEALQDYQQSLDKVYQLEDKLKDQLDLSSQSSGSRRKSRMEKKISQLEDSLKLSCINENQAYSQLKSTEDEFDRVKQELIHTNAQQAREIEILQSRLKSQENFFEKELQTTHLSLESAKDQAQKQKIETDFLKSEVERLKTFEKTVELPSSLKDLKQALKENSSQSSENLQTLSQSIDKILKEKEKLRQKLMKTEQELQLVSEECQNLHKLKFEVKKDSQFSMNSIESSSKSIQDSLIIEGISPSIVFHNPLIEKLSQLRKEPAMIYSSVWKNLEQMVVEKLKKDKKDIELGKDPQNVADFIFEFMQSQYGLKSLGLKQLKALIVSLEELYRIQHPYATFFCRILGVFHPRPIPSKVAVGLFAAFTQFNSVCRRFSLKNENFSDVYENMQFGGEASLSAVIQLVKKIFHERREAGERVLTHLHRDQPDSFELKILTICAQLKLDGLVDDHLFSKESMDYSEFIDNLRTVLGLWLSQDDAEFLCKVLDDENKGEVTKESWKSKVKFSEFCEKLETKPAMVSKADFLNSLVIEHEFQVLEDYHLLRQIVFKGNPITAQMTSQYLLQIDANLSIDFQERIFREALVYDGGHGREVSSEALCIVILKHNIGGYGKGLFFLNTLS